MSSHIITDIEAIDIILRGTSTSHDSRTPRFAAYFGAGTSVEAGVKTANQICDEIFEEMLKVRLLPGLDRAREKTQLENELMWSDPNRRYVTSIQKHFPLSASRVDYFRQLLRGCQPAFCHHALALLITHRYFRNTCLTTNFDKLIENAFIQQGDYECQPIRKADEFVLWSDKEQDRHFIIKLHGDYDTDNVQNTIVETSNLPPETEAAVRSIADQSGLVVLGTAGYEKSISGLFRSLESVTRREKDSRTLRYGLLWGIYMGQSRPIGVTRSEIVKLVEEKLNEGVINQEIRDIVEYTEPTRMFRFFPVWGAGQFMYDLIKATRDAGITGYARLYLDREMRLRDVFSSANYSESTISWHLGSLNKKRTSNNPARSSKGDIPEHAITARNGNNSVEIRIMYGDITKRRFMDLSDFQNMRRAVVSPDDTFITAGGGVAEGLLIKAGQQNILNELRKFGRTDQGEVVVTSGGKLPVHYIFHAAAIEIQDTSFCN